MAAADVLTQLTEVNLKELHRKRADGLRTIDLIYEACQRQGLLPNSRDSAATTDVRERYFAVFDVVLHHHLGCWVQDYVEVVCADRHLASNDPLEAQLLDGQFVKEWCQRSLQRTEQELVSALKSEDQFLRYCGQQLQRDLSKANTLVHVLNALERIRNSTGSAGSSALAVASTSSPPSASQGNDRQGIQGELRQALLLQQCLQVLQWCAQQRLHERPATGHYASMPDWHRRVKERRAKRQAHGLPLFLDHALGSLSVPGAYPFASLQNAVYLLFVAIREPSGEAFQAKLALLLYYLLDLGHVGGPAGTPLLDSFRSAFRLPPGCGELWHAHFLLDCAEAATAATASSDSQDSHLTRACQLLTSSMSGQAGQEEAPQPSSLVSRMAVLEVLLALGRPDVALALHRAQGGGSTRGVSMAQAATLLGLRLKCGLLTEAFSMMRAHVAGLADPAEQHAQRQALLSQLADWALASSSREAQWVKRLTELPLDGPEEDVLLGWLLQQLQRAEQHGQEAPVIDYLPLYFLQRFRVPEALAAFNKWQQVQRSLGPNPRQALIDGMVDAAVSLLPLPQRNICLLPGAQEGAGGSSMQAILQGLTLRDSDHVPPMVAGFQGCLPPPFMTTRIPPPLPLPLPCPDHGSSQQQPRGEQQGAEGAGSPAAWGSLGAEAAGTGSVLLGGDGAEGANANGFSFASSGASGFMPGQLLSMFTSVAAPDAAATATTPIGPPPSASLGGGGGLGAPPSLFSLHGVEGGPGAGHGEYTAGLQQQQQSSRAGEPGDLRTMKRPRRGAWY